MNYHGAVLTIESSQTKELLRAGSQEETREAFQESNVQILLYDFTVRGRRYRASTQETKPLRAMKAACLKLAALMANTDPLPSKPLHSVSLLSASWLGWRMAGWKRKKSYRNGWRLLKATSVSHTAVDQITGHFRVAMNLHNLRLRLRILDRVGHSQGSGHCCFDFNKRRYHGRRR